MKVETSLIGKKVKINILNPDTYTKDLYRAIQGQEGIVIEKNSGFVYEDAWLVEFNIKATKKYAKTHNGKWGVVDPSKPMSWWTESKDFILTDLN